MGDDDTGPKSAHPNAGEISPFNPRAIRDPNGIWNETTLPVVEWEVALERKVLPVEVQDLLGVPNAVVRVSIEIHEKLSTKHLASRHIYEELERFLVEHTYSGVIDAGECDIRWRFAGYVYTRSGNRNPYIAMIALQRSGEYALVSAHYRNESYIRRLVQNGELRPRFGG